MLVTVAEQCEQKIMNVREQEKQGIWFLPARRWRCAGNSHHRVSVCLSVCMSVCLCVTIIANRKSTTRFPSSHRWTLYITP